MPVRSCRKCGAPIHYKQGIVGNAAPVICESCERGKRITEELLRDEDEDREDEP